jgi:DNA-binding MarR family transcriptional regulator
MHALTADELKTLQNLADAEGKKGMAAEVGAAGTVDVAVRTLDRLEDRGLVTKVGTAAQSAGNLALTYELTDKGQEALDQTK